jgi:hypothetical protein
MPFTIHQHLCRTTLRTGETGVRPWRMWRSWQCLWKGLICVSLVLDRLPCRRSTSRRPRWIDVGTLRKHEHDVELLHLYHLPRRLCLEIVSHEEPKLRQWKKCRLVCPRVLTLRRNKTVREPSIRTTLSLPRRRCNSIFRQVTLQTMGARITDFIPHKLKRRRNRRRTLMYKRLWRQGIT